MSKVVVKNYVSMFRKNWGFTQTELARICGVSKNTISAIECGSWCPSLKLALLIAFALHTNVHELFVLQEVTGNEG